CLLARAGAALLGVRDWSAQGGEPPGGGRRGGVPALAATPRAPAERPVAFWVSMPLNAFKMPTTVPNKPTNGAVEPIVARAERPRFISACTMATERSRPRLAASITSESLT